MQFRASSNLGYVIESETAMSFFNYMFDSEWSQRADIERLKRRDESRSRQTARKNIRAQQKVRESEARIEELETQVAELEDQRGEMALYLKALLAVLLDKKSVSPEEIHAMMLKIDRADGVEDGKTTM